MSAGWVSVTRALRDDPFWTVERFSRPHAWIDLRLTADPETNKIVTSVGVLAARWKWRRARVQTFLDGLVEGGLITCTALAGVTQIRVTLPGSNPGQARCHGCGGGLAQFTLTFAVRHATMGPLCPPCTGALVREYEGKNAEDIADLDAWWRRSPE